MRKLSESFGSFNSRPMLWNFRYPSPNPPSACEPPTLKSSSAQNAMPLPKFPAVKMLNNPG